MKYSMSGWVDESVPDLSEYLSGLDIDQDEFSQWLGVLVGRYRFDQNHKFPSAGTEKKELRDYIKTLEAIIEYSTYGRLPPVVKTLLASEALNHDINWLESQDAMRKAATYALVIAQRVSAKIQNQRSAKGAPRRTGRDRLVAAVKERLEPYCQSAADARRRTEDILHACGIEVTRASDPDDAERAVRRLERKAKGTTKQKN